MLARSLWLAFVLAALGLWASLLPQVTFTSASSGEPAGDVLIAWPGWGVQQDLGPVSGTLGRFRIWVSSETERDDVTVWASLVDASTREVLRQTYIDARAGYIPVPRTLIFTSYVVPKGQRLLLQLQVHPSERSHVIYRLAGPQPGISNLMLNGVPDSGSGPLAFAHLETGSGLRAAVAGAPSERLRLGLAVAFSVLAILAHPRATAALQRAGASGRRVARWPATWGQRRVESGAAADAHASPTMIGRALAIPWYPWPVVAIPILHFLTSNSLHFAPIEAVVPLGIALVAVTGSVVSLRVGLKDWHRPAAATAAVTVVFFAYGHIERVLNGHLDERALIAGVMVLGAAAAVMAIRAGASTARATQFLNLTAAVLLAFPVASLVGGMAASFARPPTDQTAAVDDVVDRLLPAGLPTVVGDQPDIYYIILDSYSRHDALGDYDNTSFLRELERRGFYVASEAFSNYDSSLKSISSSLNMSYLDGLGQRTSVTRDVLVNISQYHAVGAILKRLGYKYVHLDSGFIATDQSPLADTLISFTPAGTIASKVTEEGTGPYTAMHDMIFMGSFVRELIQTTVLKPIAGHYLLFDINTPYGFHYPQRTLKMFEFLTSAVEEDQAKFVFAHINKPHLPAAFDQHGNYITPDQPKLAFNDRHDPSVPNAFIGQLIYINSLVLSMVDGILNSYNNDPVIVIAADHGHIVKGVARHRIVAAFHLPDGASDGLYASISSVNHFRYILDYYFDLNLGLLEDRMVED